MPRTAGTQSSVSHVMVQHVSNSPWEHAHTAPCFMVQHDDDDDAKSQLWLVVCTFMPVHISAKIAPGLLSKAASVSDNACMAGSSAT